MEDSEGEGEEDEACEEDKQSMLKLFFMGIEEEGGGGGGGGGGIMSSCTPKSLSPPTVPLKMVQVLKLWPMFPQCEHFLPIITITQQIAISRSRNNHIHETHIQKEHERERERERAVCLVWWGLLKIDARQEKMIGWTRYLLVGWFSNLISFFVYLNKAMKIYYCF